VFKAFISRLFEKLFSLTALWGQSDKVSTGEKVGGVACEIRAADAVPGNCLPLWKTQH
jgi:hypothetical protein